MAMKVDFGPRLGADPELFVTDGDAITIACGKIGGTKEKPLDVTKQVHELFGETSDKHDIGGFAIQEDNVMFEFNVPASFDAHVFVRNIGCFMEWCGRELKTKKLGASFEPTHRFETSVLDANPQSRQIGCSPDQCAYMPETGFKREALNPAVLGDVRCCGGHFHLQYNHNNVPRPVMAQFMDVVITLPWLRHDKQRDRRKFYGLPGLYRDKDYGIEYRTPSNFWIKPTFRETNLYYLATSALALGNMANTRPEHLQAAYKITPWDDVKKAIETEDIGLADEILVHVRKNTRLAIMARGE